MPATFANQGDLVEDKPLFSDQGEAVEAPSSEYDYLAPLPPITAEQLGEEHVSHPALPLQSPAPVTPTQGNQYDYLAPLLTITEAQLAEDTTPWSQRPAMTILAPRDAEGIGGIPRIPTFGPEGSKVRAASEFAQTAQETLAGGVESMTTPEATRTLSLFAIPYVGPALAAALGTKMASQGLAEVITGAELHDPRIAGGGFGKVVLAAPLLRAGVALPRSMAALEDARVAAARDITPRPPLQIPERFVEAPLPEQPIRTEVPSAVQEPSPTPQVRGVPAQPVADEGVVPAEESVAGIPRGVEETQGTGRPEVSLVVPANVQMLADSWRTAEKTWRRAMRQGTPSERADADDARLGAEGAFRDAAAEAGLSQVEFDRLSAYARETETPSVTETPQSVTDPVGNTAEFYSLPRLRALERSSDPRIAAAKKYYGAKTIPDLARLAKARFDEMAAKAKPLETREDAEMKRVQALPEGPEGEAQLVAEDIAKAVETVDVTDVAGVSPVPALVRIIRRAARDPAMKTAAEQAMRKIGDAARAQGVPLDTIKTQIAGELKAIYGDDAAEMAKSLFGEETPAPEAPKAPETAKEPWQRTRKDYIESVRQRIKESGAVDVSGTHLAGEQHRLAVEDALREGKSVPTEVLADYPSLKPAKVKLGKTDDGREFPQHEGKLLSWTVELTDSDARAGYPKAKAVLAAMRDHRPELLEQVRRDAIKGSLDPIWRNQNERLLKIIDEVTGAKPAKEAAPAETAPPVGEGLGAATPVPVAAEKGGYTIYEKPDPTSPNGKRYIIAGPEEYGIKLSAKQSGWKKVSQNLTRDQAIAEQAKRNNAFPTLTTWLERKNPLMAGLKASQIGPSMRKQYAAEKAAWEKQQGGIRPGPGAASPSEFAERTAKGAGAEPPVPPEPPVLIDAGAKPSPEIARNAKDFNIWNKANSGQWSFYFGKLGATAKAAWEKMALTAFRIGENVKRDIIQNVTGPLQSLPRPMRKRGGEVFFQVLDGKTMDAIEAEWAGKPNGDAVIRAAGQVKARLEEIRTTIRDAKRETYHGYLMGLDRQTLADLFDKNIGTAVDTKDYSKSQFADALTRDELPDDWGIADGSYLPHIFFGNWKVTAKIGETPEFVTRARTPAEAKTRIYEYVKNNPEYAKAEWRVEPDSVIPADIIRLGDRRFWHLVGQMKDALNVTSAEIKQAQQGVIGRKASKQKWFGNLKQREGYKGYSKDYEQVMNAYLSGFHRWLELSKLQREVQPMIEEVRRDRPRAADALDSIMEHLWGKPAQSTVLFDAWVDRIPGIRDYVKPLALDRWSRNIRSIVPLLTLKTVRFAVVNRLQPLQGLYPLVGERILMQAKLMQHTPEGKKLIEESGVRLDPGQYGIETGLKGKVTELSERFTGETSNQELAFLAMYQHGVENGLSRADAISYAKLRGQLLTQFTPNSADTPPALRGPFTSLLFQFKRFPIKQVELLTKMAAERRFGGLARWLVVMAATGGLSYFMRQFFLPANKRERLRRAIVKEHGENVANAVMYGFPGMVNIDLSGSLVLGDEPWGSNIYEKVGRQVTGPAGSMAIQNLSALLTDPRESTTAAQKAIDTLRRIPTLKPIAELIALEQGDVDVRTPDGEAKYRRTLKDALVALGSFRSAKESNDQSAINATVELKKQTTALKNNAYVAASSTGNIQPAIDAIQKFNKIWPEFAISSKELNEYIQGRMKGRGKTDYERITGKKFAPMLQPQP